MAKILSTAKLRSEAREAAARVDEAKAQVRSAKAQLKKARKLAKLAKKAAKQARKKAEAVRTARPAPKPKAARNAKPGAASKPVAAPKPAAPPKPAAGSKPKAAKRKTRSAVASGTRSRRPSAASVARAVIKRLGSAPAATESAKTQPDAADPVTSPG